MTFFFFFFGFLISRGGARPLGPPPLDTRLIESQTNDPRSYIVKCNGKQYRRNRKHLLLVTETAEQSDDEDIPYPRHDDPNDEQLLTTLDMEELVCLIADIKMIMFEIIM